MMGSLARAMKEQRYGVVEISGELIHSNPDILFEAFSKMKFFPDMIRMEMQRDVYTYRGVSPKFRKLSQVEEIPYFKIIFETEDGKLKRVKVVELEKEYLIKEKIDPRSCLFELNFREE